MKTIFTNAVIMDVINGVQMPDACIYVDADGKIEKIDKMAEEIPNDYNVIDIGHRYILPGLIDMHQHLMYKRTYGSLWPQMELGAPVLTVRSLKNALAELRMGITTIRSCGDIHEIDYALKHLFRAKYLIGPTIITCGKPIAITGSHVPQSFADRADGIDEFVKLARIRAARHDWVKIFASYGLTKPYHNGEYARPEVTLPELKAACDAVHNAQKKVVVHCSGSEALDIAIEAGVDSIEHGSAMTKEQAAKIAEKGIIYTPTMTALTETLNPIYDRGKKWIEDHKKGVPFSNSGLKNAVEAGAHIVVGLDSLGVVGDEAVQLNEIGGMSKWDVLRAFTINGAQALGMQDSIGSIENGKIADLAILNSNPLDNLMNLEDVYMVVKDGKCMKVEEVNLIYDFETRDYNSLIPELYN